MMHEYRPSPYSVGFCAACGLHVTACAGVKFNTPRWAGTRQEFPQLGLAVRFIKHWAGDPDETVRWRSDAQREFYAGWDAFDQALIGMSLTEQHRQKDEEVRTLESWMRE